MSEAGRGLCLGRRQRHLSRLDWYSERDSSRTKRAGVPVTPVHLTRKACASLLVALDVHPRVAMQILRHSKIAVTMEVYAEVVSSSTKDALRGSVSSSTRGIWHDRCCTLLLYGPSRLRSRLRPKSA